MTEPMGIEDRHRVELRVPVDAGEAPNVFADDCHGVDLAVELSGPGLIATLVIPTGEARL